MLVDRIRRTQSRHDFFPVPVDGVRLPVVIGVSGGADSVCLLHLLAQLADEWGLALHVAHLDHGLRPDAQDDAGFVADLAQSLGLPCHLKQMAPGALAGMGGSLEAAARSVRRAFLVEVAAAVSEIGAKSSPPPILALAHTADDQAETVLMHFLRGSGLDGLSGMRPVTRWPRTQGQAGRDATASHQYVRIVRPLLDVERTQIVRYLSERGLAWREDPTNRDPIFLRNRLRHEILPVLATLNPNVAATLGRTATILAGEAQRLARMDEEHLAGLLCAPIHPQRVVLNLDRLVQLDDADLRGVLRLGLNRLLAQDRPDPEVRPQQIEFVHVAALVNALAGPFTATGPHPITAGLAWTVAPAMAGPTSAQPARLSLHRQNALPFAPDHPFLDAAWRRKTGAICLGIPGAVGVGGWQLTARLVALDHLPKAWSDLSPWEAFLDADALGQARLAPAQPGQRFAPLGLDGRSKALGDLFTDRKIPRSLRKGWPVIQDEAGQVAWVCGLQLAHSARITPRTTQVAHLIWEELTRTQP